MGINRQANGRVKKPTKRRAKSGKAVAPQFWRNRIVASANVTPQKLLANPANWRNHPPEQSEAISGALDELGWVQRVLVNQRTGNICDGHERVRLALKRGEKKVPVDYINVSEEDEKKIVLTLNALGEMADPDAKKLEELLQTVHFESRGIDSLLTELASSIGLDEREADIPAEVQFTEELLEEHNYVVLFFDNQVDWINLCSILDIKTVKALHARKGYMSAGVGRVVRGPDALKKIQAAR